MPRATISESLQSAHSRSNTVDASSTQAGVTLIRVCGIWLRRGVTHGVSSSDDPLGQQFLLYIAITVMGVSVGFGQIISFIFDTS
jgi:hypothetical protein